MIKILKDFTSDLKNILFTEPINSSSLNEIKQNLIKDCNKFIYEGLYINHTNKIEEIKSFINEFKDSISIEISLVEDFDRQNSINLLFTENINFIKSLFDECILIFLEFVKQNTKLTYTILDSNFSFLETENKDLKETFELVNIYILEYHISEDILFYSKLIESKERLENFHNENPFTIYNIIDYKIVFLKYKWKKRQKYIKEFTQKHIDVNFSKKITIKSEEIDLSSKILIGNPYYNTFKEWIDRIELFYFENKSLIEDYNYEVYKINESQINDDFKLYFTIKFYKDFNPSFKNLESFKNSILDSKIDKKNKLYYLNNLFSCISKKDIKDNIHVADLFKQIEYQNTIFKSNNNFIYYKYLDYRINCANKLENEKILENEIKEIEKLYLICKNRFEWTHKSINYLYNFNKTDCSITVEGIKVYFPTSFLLPICIFENEYLIKQIPERIHNIKYRLFGIKTNNQNEIINNLIKNKEKDSIQTISLFTGVIAFIMGSISGFKFIDNIYNATSFIIIYGICISIFLILINKFVNKEKKNFEIMEFLPLFILLVFLAVFCIVSGEKHLLTKDDLRKELINYKVIKESYKSSQN